MTMQDSTGTTPQEKAASHSPTKNILFLAFILLSVLFCSQRFRMRFQRMDYNVGITLFNQGMELLEAEDPEQQQGASQAFLEAQESFQDARQSEMDPEISEKATAMEARCLAMRAQCPDTTARDAINLYRRAMIEDFECSEVQGLLRIHLAPMSSEERQRRLQVLRDAPPPMAYPPAP